MSTTRKFTSPPLPLLRLANQRSLISISRNSGLPNSEIQIHTFDDSLDAKEFIAHNLVDVLITDYRMLRLDGLQLLETAPPQVKKIILSGDVSDISKERLAKLNATFFQKPAPLVALAKFVSKQQVRIE
jgi:DNA-binding NtrC family response regulator